MTQMFLLLIRFYAAGPVPESTDDTGKMLLTAALAGGLASGLSTFCMHPIDTLKTRLQSSVGISLSQMVKSVPQIGTVGLYRGVLPATAGSSIGHGLRTCAYEGSLKILTALTGGAAELQVRFVQRSQSLTADWSLAFSVVTPVVFLPSTFAGKE